MAEEFNVLEHELVPEHHLLSQKEAAKVMSELNLSKDQLPKIRISDPCVVTLDQVSGPIEEGRIIKIVRRSSTSGVSVCYRLVVRG